jgi:hypothetical protein
MSLEFDPLTEEQLFNLMPAGDYDFYVKGAEKHLSKSGNMSIKLTLAVYDANGKEFTIPCYLTTKYMFLLKHFMDAVGLDREYNQGKLTPEICFNLSGRCRVEVEEPEEGSPFFPKNVIKDFLKGGAKAVQSAPMSEPGLNDDIPF